jgi:succinate dehydrogenase hydrophobic anchor subunit
MRRGDLYLSAIAFACLVTFVIGWPSAFVSGALIALVFGKRVIEGDRLASIATVLAATACGYIGVRIVWTYYNDLDGLRTMTIAGTIAGFVSGVCFCYLARLDRESSSRDSATPPSPA